MKIKSEKKRQDDCRFPYQKPSPQFSLHPLFIAVGIFYCFKGELFLFLMSCLIALQHECAHAFAAARLGYRLNKVVLMPFGALIDGDLEGLTKRDEICVALAGPICNLCTAILFVALWWTYPATYPFTDTAFYVSVSIFAVNLIPAYPLDGGRVLKSLLFTQLLKSGNAEIARRKSEKICKKITIFFAALLLFLFVFSCVKNTANVSMLFFALFLGVGAFEKNVDGRYVKMEFSQKQALSRGMVMKKVALLSTTPIKKALTFLNEGEYLILSIYDEKEEFLGEVTQNELADFFIERDVYTPIEEILRKNSQKKW
jgi:stage IV sporulation protein FB